MIRTDAEYRLSVERVAGMDSLFKQQQSEFKAKGHDKAEIKRLLDPMKCFQAQIKEEIALYERLKRGEFQEAINLGSLGQTLIAIRIARGVTQRDLAQRLNVSESQVSRDERNEYHGITIDRAQRILEALSTEIRMTVVSKSPAPAKPRATRAKSSRA